MDIHSLERKEQKEKNVFYVGRLRMYYDWQLEVKWCLSRHARPTSCYCHQPRTRPRLANYSDTLSGLPGAPWSAHAAGAYQCMAILTGGVEDTKDLFSFQFSFWEECSVAPTYEYTHCTGFENFNFNEKVSLGKAVRWCGCGGGQAVLQCVVEGGGWWQRRAAAVPWSREHS